MNKRTATYIAFGVVAAVFTLLSVDVASYFIGQSLLYSPPKPAAIPLTILLGATLASIWLYPTVAKTTGIVLFAAIVVSVATRQTCEACFEPLFPDDDYSFELMRALYRPGLMLATGVALVAGFVQRK